jgi:hypothetical protein
MLHLIDRELPLEHPLQKFWKINVNNIGTL